MRLSGKRILVTRPRTQAADLCDKLAALGAEPIQFPTIVIRPLGDYAELDQAVARLVNYQWIIFTSVNGVAAFWQRLEAAGQDSAASPGALPAALPGALAGLQVAAIGPATARALEKRGVTAHFIPDEYVAEAIVAGIGDVHGQRILLPRADIAREALTVELERRGALVEEITAYRTLPAAPDAQALTELRRGVDAITFTSSSTVRNFVALVGQAGILSYGQPAIACIGPITAHTARELGLPVNVVATEYTMDGLVAALVKHFQED